MSESESENEVDETVLARLGEVLTQAQSGNVGGIICICFMANDTLAIQVAGEQNLVVRLGSLQVAADALKVLESQQQAMRQQQVKWGPGGNA